MKENVNEKDRSYAKLEDALAEMKENLNEKDCSYIKLEEENNAMKEEHNAMMDAQK